MGIFCSFARIRMDLHNKLHLVLRFFLRNRRTHKYKIRVTAVFFGIHDALPSSKKYLFVRNELKGLPGISDLPKFGIVVRTWAIRLFSLYMRQFPLEIIIWGTWLNHLINPEFLCIYIYYYIHSKCKYALTNQEWLSSLSRPEASQLWRQYWRNQTILGLWSHLRAILCRIWNDVGVLINT